MRVLCGLLAVMFVYFAYLQLNDPDPQLWIPAYLAPAAVCAVRAIRGRVPWQAPAAVGGAALVWCLFWLRDAIPGFSHSEEVFGAMTMRYPGVEEAREMLGLVIIAIGMAVAAVRPRSGS